MAGGSTDAAAVLYGMNRIFDLGLSKEDLMTRGVKLGADVPYCIMRGTALAEGIGEKLSALPPMVKYPDARYLHPASDSHRQILWKPRLTSGSGPTVFGLFANGDTAVAAYEAMRESNLAKQVYLTSIYNNAR